MIAGDNRSTSILITDIIIGVFVPLSLHFNNRIELWKSRDDISYFSNNRI